MNIFHEYERQKEAREGPLELVLHAPTRDNPRLSQPTVPPPRLTPRSGPPPGFPRMSGPASGAISQLAVQLPLEKILAVPPCSRSVHLEPTPLAARAGWSSPPAPIPFPTGLSELQQTGLSRRWAFSSAQNAAQSMAPQPETESTPVHRASSPPRNLAILQSPGTDTSSLGSTKTHLAPFTSLVQESSSSVAGATSTPSSGPMTPPTPPAVLSPTQRPEPLSMPGPSTSSINPADVPLPDDDESDMDEDDNEVSNYTVASDDFQENSSPTGSVTRRDQSRKMSHSNLLAILGLQSNSCNKLFKAHEGGRGGDRDRDRDEDRDREHDDDGGQERDKGREKYHDRGRERNRDKGRERNQQKVRDRDRVRGRERERHKGRRDRDRGRNRERDRTRHRSRRDREADATTQRIVDQARQYLDEGIGNHGRPNRVADEMVNAARAMPYEVVPRAEGEENEPADRIRPISIIIPQVKRRLRTKRREVSSPVEGPYWCTECKYESITGWCEHGHRVHVKREKTPTKRCASSPISIDDDDSSHAIDLTRRYSRSPWTPNRKDRRGSGTLHLPLPSLEDEMAAGPSTKYRDADGVMRFYADGNICPPSNHRTYRERLTNPQPGPSRRRLCTPPIIHNYAVADSTTGDGYGGAVSASDGLQAELYDYDNYVDIFSNTSKDDGYEEDEDDNNNN